MSKKLLNETQIRRFAKLAHIPAINENDKWGGNKGDEPESETDYQEGRIREEDAFEDVEAEVDAELPGGEEVEMAPGEEEITDDPGEDSGDLAAREELAMDVITAVADALDIQVDIEGGEDAAEDMDDLGGEPDLGGLEGEETMDVEEEEEMMMEALRGINYIPGKKEIINEVAKRVAKRLLKAKKAEQQLQEALGKRKATAKRKAPPKKSSRSKTTARKAPATRTSRRRARK